jgi:hypothetical protein
MLALFVLSSLKSCYRSTVRQQTSFRIVLKADIRLFALLSLLNVVLRHYNRFQSFLKAVRTLAVLDHQEIYVN